MAVKQVVVSDMGGTDLEDGEAARLVVSDHPRLEGRIVELDVSVVEAEKLVAAHLSTVSLTVYLPGETDPRPAILDVKTFEQLFPAKTDVAAVLQGARSGSGASTRRSRQLNAVGPIDYTDDDRYGQLHRGKVTDAEAALVRENREQASKNRVAQGHASIDWSSEAEKKRYGTV